MSFWRDWLATGTFPDHPWRPYIERSALTLKGLSYAPTGAIMAASTTSLPETPGGARNWDYRFTWIRDTGFMLRSLYRLGFDWEALEYFAFVLESVSQGKLDQPFELQIMYGIGGERDLTESTLDHLSGYDGARPVRVGNGAWDQHQNDVWGMLLDGVDQHFKRGAAQIVPPVWEGLAGLVEEAISHSGDADQGIWEIRGEPQHFTASAVLCWVAADRGADLAQRRGDSERAVRWREAADEMKTEILAKGVDARGRFRQAYENEDLDASLLAHPHHGISSSRRRAGEGHGPGHRRRADRGRAGAPLQGGQHRHRVRREGGHLHHLLVVAGLGVGHDRRDRSGTGAVQEAALLRRPTSSLRRGDRSPAHGRAPRELSPGIHPPGPDRRSVATHRGGEETA